MVWTLESGNMSARQAALLDGDGQALKMKQFLQGQSWPQSGSGKVFRGSKLPLPQSGQGHHRSWIFHPVNLNAPAIMEIWQGDKHNHNGRHRCTLNSK